MKTGMPNDFGSGSAPTKAERAPLHAVIDRQLHACCLDHCDRTRLKPSLVGEYTLHT